MSESYNENDGCHKKDKASDKENDPLSKSDPLFFTLTVLLFLLN